MALSRKHFNAMAIKFGELRYFADNAGDDQLNYAQQLVVNRAIRSFCEVAINDNPNFDFSRFYNAVDAQYQLLKKGA